MAIPCLHLLNITRGSYNAQLDHGDMSRWLANYSFTCKPIFLLANIYLMFCFLQVRSKKSHNFSTFGAILSLTTLCTRKISLEIRLLPVFNSVGAWYFNCSIGYTLIFEKTLLERNLMLNFWRN